MRRRGHDQAQDRGEDLRCGNRFLALAYHVQGGNWNITSRGRVSFRAKGFQARAQVDGQWVETLGHPVEECRRVEFADSLGEGTRMELSHRASEEPVVLTLSIALYRERPSVVLQVGVRNRTEALLRLGEIRLVEMDADRGGVLHPGEGSDVLKFYQESNNIHGAAVLDLAQSGAEDCESGWLGLVYNPGARMSFLGGFLTVHTALGKIKVQYRPDQGLARWYAACKYDGLELGAREELWSEKLYLDVRQDPFQALEAFAAAVAAENQLPAIQETPALWCSWYPYRLALREDDVLLNAQVIARRLRGYGVNLLQLDYGWNDADTPGNWSTHEERFPHGLRWLVEQLASMGLDLGLWIAPFTVFEHSRFFQDHPDAVITDSHGRPAPWQTPWPWEPKQDIHDLDVRRTESQEFIARTFRELASLGIRYFKMDFLNGPSTAPLSFTAGIRNEDRVRDGERMRIGLSLIRQAVGDGAYLLGCNLPHSHGLGLVSAVFGAGDVGNSYFGRDESWVHCKRRTSSLIGRYYQQKKLWHLDPDVIYLGGNPPDFAPVSDLGEARLRTTAVALSGGPVILGDNLAALPAERLAMYTLCLPALGRPARPVDLFSHGHPRIWDLKVDTAWGNWDVVGLFNYENQPITIPVAMADLGLRSRNAYVAWEFWEQQFLGIHSQRIEVDVPARGVRLVLLKAAPRRPDFLSTTLHLSQGGVEVPEVSWDGRRRALSGMCRRPPGAVGALLFYLPGGWVSRDCRIAGAETPAREIAPGVVMVDVEFVQGEVPWHIRFHKTRPQ